MLRIFSILLAALPLMVRANDVIWPPPAAPTGTPTAEFPLPRYDQLGQFLDHVRQARSQPVDLIFDGDSITDYWQGTGRDLLQKLYVPRHMVDYAIAGDRTEHVLWRLAHGELDTLHPKLAMLMIGTNNIGNSTPEEIADAITKIVQTYRQQAPDMHVLLLGIFPRGNSPADPARSIIRQINASISQLDDGEHVTYLDIGQKFLQPDGTLTAQIMPDFLHPSAQGYQIWADAVQPMIDKYCPAEATADAAVRTGPSAPPTPAQVDSTLPTLSWPFEMHPPAGTPTALFPVPHADWYGRFQGNLDKLKQGPFDFVMDGDSITDNWQGPGQDVLKQRYGGYKTLDVAIGGDQVQHVLWRLNHGDLEGVSPKLIMLMIGTNNGGQDPKDIAGGIKLVLDGYKQRCPAAHVLLLGVFPREAQPNTPTRQWVKQINALLSTYADDRITYLDIGDKFLQPDGTLTAEIMPDFLHPSAKGYTIWADAIQPVIDQYLGKPAAATP